MSKMSTSEGPSSPERAILEPSDVVEISNAESIIHENILETSTEEELICALFKNFDTNYILYIRTSLA